MKLLVFTFLFFPVFLIRYFILQKGKKYKFKIHVCSIFQDVTFSFQLFFLFLLLPKNFIGGALFLITACFSNISILLDALLYRSAKIKMSFLFYRYFVDFKSYFDSVKKRDLITFASSFLILLLYYVLVNKYYFFNVSSQDNLLYFGVLFLIFSVVSFFLVKYFKNKKLDHLNNILISTEVNFLYLIKNLIFRKKGYLQNEMEFEDEKSQRISSKFPILRFTKSYIGEKTFDIDISKDEPPNIIFLSMESFRTKDIGVYGAKHNVTKNFDRLSKEGILFKNFYSTGCFSNNSSIGAYFGILLNSLITCLSKLLSTNLISLPKCLNKMGYLSSILMGARASFNNEYKFFKQNDFEKVLGFTEIKKHFKNPEYMSWGIHDEYLFDYSVKYLKENKNRPNFLSILTITNHHPWTLPKSYMPNPDPSKSDFQRYLDTIEYMDHCLDKFIKDLEKEDLLKNTIIFIYGDHGQIIDEGHSNFQVSSTLKEEALHIPLLIYAKNRIKKPKIIDELSSKVDLFPTVLDMLNLPSLNHSLGKSLMRKNQRKCVFFNNFNYQPIYGCRYKNYKYILALDTKEEKLYDLNSDPKETNNLIDKEREIGLFLNKRVLDNRNLLTDLYKNKSFCPDTKKIEFIYAPPKNVDDETLLRDLKKSKYLYWKLNDCQNISKKALIQVLQNAQDLLGFECRECFCMTDEVLFEMSKKCKKLNFLDISNCQLITDRGIEYIIQNCNDIEGLNLQDIRDLKQLNFLKTLNNLSIINLNGCERINDITFENIMKYCPFLKLLYLNTSNISDDGFIKASNYKSALRAVLLYEVFHIKDESILAFLNASNDMRSIDLVFTSIKNEFFKNLKLKTYQHITISNCNTISDGAIEYMKYFSLKTLSIMFCNNINGSTLGSLIDIPSILIEIWGCPAIEKETLSALREKGLELYVDGRA
jgi:phosphoglycerol transferase MdoB-like AlkP superfamily enzyme